VVVVKKNASPWKHTNVMGKKPFPPRNGKYTRLRFLEKISLSLAKV
jgi:hypothetical protein